MSKELIELVEEKIKNCEDTKLVANSRIISLKKQIEEAERDLFRANNVQASLKGALTNLIDARDRDADIAAIRPIPEEEKPADYLGSLDPAAQKAAIEAEAIKEEKKHPYLKDRKEEPSAMSKIGADIEEEIKEDELTDEEKTKRALDDADQLIEREKKREEQKKKGWKLCSKCNSNRISPANKKGICTPCQLKRKTDRPYGKRKKNDSSEKINI